MASQGTSITSFPHPAHNVVGFHRELWCFHMGHPLGRGSSGYSGTWRLFQAFLQTRWVIAQIAADVSTFSCPRLLQEVQRGGWGVVSAPSHCCSSCPKGMG